MLKIIARQGEYLLIRGTAILTFARVRGEKVAVLVDGPGRCWRQKALEKMLTAKQYQQLMSQIRGAIAPRAKSKASPR